LIGRRRGKVVMMCGRNFNDVPGPIAAGRTSPPRSLSPRQYLKAGFGPHDRSPLPNPPPLPTPPLASTDGSATRNLNKTGVRFWTYCGRSKAGSGDRRSRSSSERPVPATPFRHKPISVYTRRQGRSNFRGRCLGRTGGHHHPSLRRHAPGAARMPFSQRPF
jgi:hypothetical protein